MAKKNKNKNRIKDVLAPFSPKQIRRETNARVRLQFGEAGRALRGDIRASQQDSRNINSWYQQYQNQMNALRTQQAGNTQALQDQMNRNAEALGGQAAARSSAVADDQSRSAAIRGAMVDPSAGATESAADRQRQALLASSRDRAAQMGASSNQRLAGVNAAAELGRQADQRQERNTRLETRAKIRDLVRDKGAARVTNRGEIIRGERDYDISRRTLNSNIRNDQAELALARQKEARYASEGSGGSGGSGGGKGGGGVDAADVRRASSYIRATLSKNGLTWRDVANDPQTVIDGLVNRGVDSRTAKVAVRRFIRRKKKGARPKDIGDIKGGDHN